MKWHALIAQDSVATSSKRIIPAVVDNFGRRHYLYEQKIARMTWKIDNKDLLMAALEADTSASDKAVRSFHLSLLSVHDISIILYQECPTYGPRATIRPARQAFIRPAKSP